MTVVLILLSDYEFLSVSDIDSFTLWMTDPTTMQIVDNTVIRIAVSNDHAYTRCSLCLIAPNGNTCASSNSCKGRSLRVSRFQGLLNEHTMIIGATYLKSDIRLALINLPSACISSCYGASLFSSTSTGSDAAFLV